LPQSRAARNAATNGDMEMIAPGKMASAISPGVTEFSAA